MWWKSKPERPGAEATFNSAMWAAKQESTEYRRTFARIVLDAIADHLPSGSAPSPRVLDEATSARHAVMRAGARDESDPRYSGHVAAEALCEAALRDRDGFARMLAAMRALEQELWPERHRAPPASPTAVATPKGVVDEPTRSGEQRGDDAPSDLERAAMRVVFDTLMTEVEGAEREFQLAFAHMLNLVNTMFAGEFGNVNAFRNKPLAIRSQYIEKLSKFTEGIGDRFGPTEAGAALLFQMWLTAAQIGDAQMERDFGARLAKVSRLHPTTP